MKKQNRERIKDTYEEAIKPFDNKDRDPISEKEAKEIEWYAIIISSTILIGTFSTLILFIYVLIKLINYIK